MTRADLPALDILCRDRNVHTREYERFVELEGASGLILTDESGVIGAVTSMRYFEHGFLGPVLLRPTVDGVGLAIALLAHAIEGLQREGVNVIEAEAADEEALVLRSMGFEAIRTTLVHQRGPGPAPSSGATRPMMPADLLDVGALDADAAGWGRKEYLATLQHEHPEGARVTEQEGDITGYALVRRSRRGYHVGPIVTRGDDEALASLLLRDAVASVASWPLVALSPAEPRMQASLERAGFTKVGELTRLRAGRRDDAGRAAAAEWLLGGRITG